jgi:hypothetical protein
MSDDSETPAHRLDDQRDRDELRNRYYGLMQELRIVLPGVQVLVAFLLTVPFAQGFAQIDDFGRGLFGAALIAAILSVVAFITPTALHRFGDRTARGERLQISILTTRVGLLLLAIAMTLSLAVVSRYLYDGIVTVLLVVIVVVAVGGFWIVTPLMLRRGDRD